MAALMTARQVAERWGVDDSFVHKLAARRELRGLKFGRAWRFRPEDVEAYEAGRVVEAEQPARQQPIRSASQTAQPAVAFDGGEYRPVVSGPVPWRSSVVDAASPAARRGVSASKRKRA